MGGGETWFIESGSGLAYRSCDSLTEFGNLTLHLGDFYFDLKPEEYVQRDAFFGVCYVMIQPMNFKGWILGDVFMRNRPTVFDMDGMQVGIYDASHRQAPAIKKKIPIYQIIILVGIVLLALWGSYALYRCWKTKREQREILDQHYRPIEGSV